MKRRTATGGRATLTDGQGNTTRWNYDPQGRVLAKWYQDEINENLIYQYNANGWLTGRFQRTGLGGSTNGYWTTYAYDAAGQLTNVVYPSGTPSVSFAYDALGRVQRRVDGLGTTTYAYGMPGNGQRTVTEDGPWPDDAVTVTNLAGRPSGLTVAQPAGQWWTAWSCDAAGRWDGVSSPAGTFQYAYPQDATAEPIGLSLPNGGWITNRYDAAGRLTSTELYSPAGALLNLHGCDYDPADRRVWLSRTNAAAPYWNGWIDADYDGAGQLARSWRSKPDGSPYYGELWGYHYDPAQNLLQRTNHLAVETFEANPLNQLTRIPDSTPAYDRAGNLKSRAFSGSRYWFYDWDHENRLTTARTDDYYTPEGERWKVELVYDGLGRLRIKRDYRWYSGYGWYLNDERRYLYAGWLLAQERSGGNGPLASYTRGRDLSGTLNGAGGIGGLLARSHGYRASDGAWSTHNYCHADGNGNITAMAGASGALSASYRYDPYGRTRSLTGSMASANPLRCSSKPWIGFNNSNSTGLYYYGYRWYDPYLQRWLSRDPLGEAGGVNIYAYVNNAPLFLLDPYGLSNWGWSHWYDWLLFYPHTFYDLGDSFREGIVSIVTGIDTAVNGGERRIQEFEEACDPNADVSGCASQVVLNALQETRDDILDIVTGVPGTSITGPPPTDRIGLHVSTAQCEVYNYAR